LSLAQLEDLYGSTYSTIPCRTLVVGSKKVMNKIQALLRIGSYFIRCGEIIEKIQVMDRPASHEHPLFKGGYIDTPLPNTKIIKTIPNEHDLLTTKLYYLSLGRSLFGDFTTTLVSELVLSGLEETLMDENELLREMKWIATTRVPPLNIEESEQSEQDGVSRYLIMRPQSSQCELWEYRQAIERIETIPMDPNPQVRLMLETFSNLSKLMPVDIVSRV
jgi:hypothetical protein